MPKQSDRDITGYTFHLTLSVGLTDLAEAERFIVEQLAQRFGTGGDRGEEGEWRNETKGYPRWKIGSIIADHKVEEPY